MDITRLRALRELSIRQTMAAAAEALSLTPSAISQQIAQLEEELGVQLTERRGRGVRLTPAGELLVIHAERMMTVLDEAKSDIAEIKKEIAGELRVAAFPSIGAALLPHAVKALRARYPHLAIVLDEMEPADGLAALGSWQVDVALIDNLSLLLPGKQHSVEQVPLTEDLLCVIVPADHALAMRPSLSISDLKTEGWALDSTSSTYGDFVLNLCRRAGYEPILNAKCRSFDMVCAMVASGCSISLVPRLRLVHSVQGVSVVKFRPEVRRKISVAYRRGERRHPAVKVFVEQLVVSAALIDSKISSLV
ncbi:LysR family transcriptional regulator [Hydrogenophaga sp.]|uniref:LysR family transcriptional regulator n=1 Tax=Hydrogenophaga sp. TaxID=1904254 RepID=UPI002FC6C4B8